MVDALALGGQLDEAHDLFERVMGYANDIGLLSEEIDPATGAFLGNFPQGFAHLGLIRSAVNLAKAAKHGAEEQPETEPERAERAGAAASQGYSARVPRLQDGALVMTRMRATKGSSGERPGTTGRAAEDRSL